MDRRQNRRKALLAGLKKAILYGLPFLFLFVCYRVMMGVAVATSVTLFFLSYGGAMSLNYLGSEKLKLLEERNLLTIGRRARYTFLVFSPVYLFWLLFSLLPVPSFEIWMVTGFPVMIVGFFSFGIYMEEWPRGAKRRYLALQIPIYLLCLLIGQSVGSALFVM